MYENATLQVRHNGQISEQLTTKEEKNKAAHFSLYLLRLF